MFFRYRDPQFWKKFYDRHWYPRVPTVFRQPFQEFPFSEALLLRSMKAFAEGVRNGDQRKTCLISVGNAEKAPRRPLRALFKEESNSFDELERNCERVFDRKKFGLMVCNMQATDPGVWNGLTSFIQDAREGLGNPALPRAYVDLFYGNYESTFTGLHKDIQDIVAFVVRGEKRMLAWPFEYFLTRVKGVTAADKYFNRRLPIDHRKYRKDAIVLDAKAGDVIYWPSDHWHVSEGRGKFSAMLSLGLFRPDVVATTAEGDLEPSPEQLRWMTGFGFEIGGPIAEKASLASTVAKVASSRILWSVQNGRLNVSANGHAISFPHSPKLSKLVERVSKGERVSPSGKPQSKPSKILETNWQMEGALKTRKKTSRNDERALLDWLLRVHAVEPAASNSSRPSPNLVGNSFLKER